MRTNGVVFRIKLYCRWQFRKLQIRRFRKPVTAPAATFGNQEATAAVTPRQHAFAPRPNGNLPRTRRNASHETGGETMNRTSKQHAAMTTAGLNLIAQALSIYDNDLRLAVCNRRFQEMFNSARLTLCSPARPLPKPSATWPRPANTPRKPISRTLCAAGVEQALDFRAPLSGARTPQRADNLHRGFAAAPRRLGHRLYRHHPRQAGRAAACAPDPRNCRRS